MPTIHQLTRKKREQKVRKSKSPVLGIGTNSIQKKQERLIEITADGQIGKSEIEDFVEIQKQLEKISITVEAMQLWSEKMLASGAIDKDEYEAAMKNQSNS